MTILKRFSQFLLSALLLAVALPAEATPVSEGEMRLAVGRWLELKEQHFGAELSGPIRQAVRYQGGFHGDVGYWLVILQKGWLVVPADDRHWPVQVFGGGDMTPSLFEGSLWHATIGYDGERTGRISVLSAQAAEDREIAHNQTAWGALRHGPHRGGVRAAGLDELPAEASRDVRVYPFLGAASQWEQRSLFLQKTTFSCLNIQSPDVKSVEPYEAYPVGCTALATAQALHVIMTNGGFDFTGIPLSAGSPLGKVNLKFHITTSLDLGPDSRDEYDSFEFKSNLLTGPSLLNHDWNAMRSYQKGAPEGQNASIISGEVAPLLHDLGLMLGMNYSKNISTAESKRRVFLNLGFKQAQVFEVLPQITLDGSMFYSSFDTADKATIIHPNLDAGLPVILGVRLHAKGGENGAVSFDVGGHTVVVDGYAYPTIALPTTGDLKIPYYHVCTGWGHYEGNTWKNDEGVWSYGLTSKIREGDGGIISDGLAFNLIPDVRAFKRAGATREEREKNFGNAQVELVSGRVLRLDPANPRGLAPVPGADVSVSWGNKKGYTTSTDAQGIYAFAVPSGTEITLKVTSPDDCCQPIVKEVKQTSVPSSQWMDLLVYPADQVKDHIGNLWGLDFVAEETAVLPSAMDDTEFMVRDWASRDMPYDPELAPLSYRVLTQAEVASPDFMVPNVKVLVLGGDLKLSVENEYPQKFVEKVAAFVTRGGTLLVAGKSESLVEKLGKPLGFELFKKTEERKIGGFSNETRHEILNATLRQRIGVNSIRVASRLPRNKQSAIENPGSAKSLTAALYAVLERKLDPIPAPGLPPQFYWDAHLEKLVTAIDFRCGKGRVIYFTNELAALHAVKPYGQRFCDLMLSALLTQQEVEAGTAGKSAAADNTPKQVSGLTGKVFNHPLGSGRTRVADAAAETLRFGPRIASDDVKLVRVDDDLELRIEATGESATVPNWFSGGSGVRTVEFSDGSVLDAARIEAMARPGEPEIDMTPVSVDVRIWGTENDDRLAGDGRNGMFFGLGGDDVITGGPAENVYYYRLGEGDDTLVLSGRRDVLRFHTDIASANVRAAREGDDMVLRVGPGSVRVRGWYAGRGSRLDRVEFYDGEIWDSRDLERLAAGRAMVAREFYLDSKAHGGVDSALEPEANADTKSSGSGTSSGCDAGLGLLGLAALAVAAAAGKRSMR